MIVYDLKLASILASGALAFGVLSAAPALADTVAVSAPGAAATSVAPPSTVTIVSDTGERTYATKARTIGEFFRERDLHVGPADYVSPDADTAVSDGMKVSYRPAVPVHLSVDRRNIYVRSAAATVGELLEKQHVAYDAHDDIEPPLASRIAPGEKIEVAHVAVWTSHVRQRVEKVTNRTDAKMLAGKTRVVDRGSPGLRLTTYRFVKHGADAPTRSVLASRIVREPRAKVIVHGIATYASLARVATQGFESAVHFAGSALHMIATAYTAGCAGCSGITASGVRAGFGVIAVDPRVIPLGTKLFVAGYGRAVAGDTGGAILGNRIDLGMQTQHDAMRFGRRPVTVYVLR